MQNPKSNHCSNPSRTWTSWLCLITVYFDMCVKLWSLDQLFCRHTFFLTNCFSSLYIKDECCFGCFWSLLFLTSCLHCVMLVVSTAQDTCSTSILQFIKLMLIETLYILLFTTYMQLLYYWLHALVSCCIIDYRKIINWLHAVDVILRDISADAV